MKDSPYKEYYNTNCQTCEEIGCKQYLDRNEIWNKPQQEIIYQCADLKRILKMFK